MSNDSAAMVALVAFMCGMAACGKAVDMASGDACEKAGYDHGRFSPLAGVKCWNEQTLSVVKP